MQKKSCLALIFLLPFFVHAQGSFSTQYRNAKELFAQGKYNLAMESFKALIPYDRNNQYAEYASFYYALSAYKQGYKSVAKDMLNQIKTTYPKWDKLDDVNFWLAQIHFDNHDYFQGLKLLSAISDKKFEKDILASKSAAISQVKDVETLRMMNEEYPKDEVIGRNFAAVLSVGVLTEEDKKTLESLIDRFKLSRSNFIPEAPKTYHKDHYSVSLLMPFRVNALDPTPSKKPNQIVLDFYEGMKVATDTLNKMGIHISLRAYDSERDLDRLKRLLNTEELKNTDLIVGPFFPEENKIVQQFSLENNINVIHPFSNLTEVIGTNPHAYLFQPSAETLGRKSAEFLAPKATRKNTIVFYGTAKKDSISAAHFIQKATELGLNVVHSEKIQAREAGKILDILVTPTEYDEFRYPIEFTLKKDSIGSIYVASDEALIYAKIVTSVERRADSIRVVGSENWLDDTAVDPEKYQTLRMTLTAPNYINPSKDAYKIFFRSFVNRYGRIPSPVARMGYEMMLVFGNQLKKNGVYFQEGLSKSVIPGFLFEGYDYRSGRTNELIPFITLSNGRLTIIEKR